MLFNSSQTATIFSIFCKEIGQVSDVEKCQILCKNLYHATCEWFMYDRTTNDCLLFSGSLNDLKDDCREVGYAKEPNHASCNKLFPPIYPDGCYVSTLAAS